MKRFLFLSMLVFIVIMVWVSVHEKEDDVPLPQKLERAMRLTRMMEYQDDDYDYVVRYPGFFEQTDDSLLEKGCCRFSFWQDSTEIVQTAFVGITGSVLLIIFKSLISLCFITCLIRISLNLKNDQKNRPHDDRETERLGASHRRTKA